MESAGGKKNPYGVSSDPMRGEQPNEWQATSKRNVAGDLKRKQKKSVEDTFNQEDPIGNAVRSLWKKVRG